MKDIIERVRELYSDPKMQVKVLAALSEALDAGAVAERVQDRKICPSCGNAQGVKDFDNDSGFFWECRNCEHCWSYPDENRSAQPSPPAAPDCTCGQVNELPKHHDATCPMWLKYSDDLCKIVADEIKQPPAAPATDEGAAALAGSPNKRRASEISCQPDDLPQPLSAAPAGTVETGAIEQRLQQILEREQAATKGPWDEGAVITCDGDGCKNCWHTFDKQAEVFPPLGESGPVAVTSEGEHQNNAFVAHARADIPWLCAQLATLLDRVKAAEAIVAKLPLTTDGVPIMPGQEVWIIRRGAAHAPPVMSIGILKSDYVSLILGEFEHKIFSSKQVAEAAALASTPATAKEGT
jgi:hypothetical protein